MTVSGEAVTKASVNYRPGSQGPQYPHCGNAKTCAMWQGQGNLRVGECHNPDGSTHVLGLIEADHVCKDWTPKGEEDRT